MSSTENPHDSATQAPPARRKWPAILGVCTAAILVGFIILDGRQLIRARRASHVLDLISDLHSPDQAKFASAQDELAHLRSALEIRTAVEALVSQAAGGWSYSYYGPLHDAIARIGRPVVPVLLQAAVKPPERGSRWPWRAGAAEYTSEVGLERHDTVAMALASVGPEAADDVLPALRSSDPDVLYVAVHYFRAWPDPRAVEPLIEALTAGDRATASKAARALGFIGNQRSVQPLADYYGKTRDTETLLSLEIIGTDDAKKAVDALIAPSNLAEIAKDFKGCAAEAVHDGFVDVEWRLAFERYGTVEAAVELAIDEVFTNEVWDWANRKGLLDRMYEVYTARLQERQRAEDIESSEKAEAEGEEIGPVGSTDSVL